MMLEMKALKCDGSWWDCWTAEDSVDDGEKREEKWLLPLATPLLSSSTTASRPNLSGE